MITRNILHDPPPLSIIPDSAPFDAQQRAWLNGFLAGWLGLQADAHDRNAPARSALTGHVDHRETQTQTPTRTQNSSEPEKEEFPWHDPSLSLEQRVALAEDRPLARQLMAAMAQLDCGACGYVCQTYAEALASGEQTQLTLCSPGGRETTKALKQLLQRKSAPEIRPQAAHTVPAAPVAAPPLRGYHRSHPVQAAVLSVRNLNGPDSRKHTSHVVCDLRESGIDYHVGDSLGVIPTNCPQLVDQILALTHGADQAIRHNGRTGRLPRDLLIQQADLATIPDALIEQLFALVTDASERDLLWRLKEGSLEVADIDVYDLLRQCPSARLEAAELSAILGQLQPRLYSISSSAKAHPGQVHLTVARVAYEKGGRMRKGVASTMLADRVVAGDPLAVYVQRSHGFTVPVDPTSPMIMVGPGTGIAPFRAFLQERQATGATGKNWLFFGDQHEATDYLYRDELEQFHVSGLLTRLDTAFSRDQAEKIYVQHRLQQHGAEVFSWLQAGAYFFVCGDAKNMARDVDRALQELVAQHGRMSTDQAQHYINQLKTQQRYLRDVY